MQLIEKGTTHWMALIPESFTDYYVDFVVSVWIFFYLLYGGRIQDSGSQGFPPTAQEELS